MKIEKKLTLLLLCIAPLLHAADTFNDYVLNSFLTYYQRGINEKVYVQTDKPYYSAGENIWLKGFVVNAITHAPITTSQFLYVELVDQRDSVYTRIKIKGDEYGFHNAIALPNDMPAGDYTLCAYTQWMRNWGSELFFHKRLSIVNAIDDRVHLTTTYHKGEDGEVTATIKLLDSAKQPLAATDLNYYYSVGEEREGATITTNSEGEFTLLLPPDRTSNCLEVVSTNEMNSFTREVYLPHFTDSLDLQFFPEGGALLANTVQQVAFKAVGVDGLSREVKGAIYNSRDEEVAQLQSHFKGMGQLFLQTTAGEQYYALVQHPTDTLQSLRYELPPVVTTGCALAATQRGERLMYRIISTPDIDPHKLGVVIYSRGRIISAYGVKATNTPQLLSLAGLPEGILTLAVVDTATYEPISERLIFVAPSADSCAITTNATHYPRRAKVELSLQLRDGEGNPIEGSFALAVTDRKLVDQSRSDQSIVSHLLLTSDLLGAVESPTQYFTSQPTLDSRHRDLLLLTQGWRRFALGDVLRHTPFAYDYEVEQAMVIDGEVRRVLGSPAKGASLMVFNMTTGQNTVTKLGDEQYQFRLSGLDYPDSTRLIIQSLGRFGGAHSTNLTLTPELFPTPLYRYPAPLFQAERAEAEPFVPEEYITQSKQRYYFEGGMRVYELDQVTVIANRKAKAESTTYAIPTTTSFTVEEIDRYSNLTVIEAIKFMHGVSTNSDGSLSIRGAEEVPLFVLDEIPTDQEFVENLPMTQVQSLGILNSGETGVFGFHAAGGAIVITLKPGGTFVGEIPTVPSMAVVKRLGYKAPVALYQPRYDLPEVRAKRDPDLRTTLCWQPCLTTDSTGVATLNFFTADDISTYDVVLEGVSTQGKVVRCVTSVERRD